MLTLVVVGLLRYQWVTLSGNKPLLESFFLWPWVTCHKVIVQFFFGTPLIKELTQSIFCFGCYGFSVFYDFGGWFCFFYGRFFFLPTLLRQGHSLVSFGNI